MLQRAHDSEANAALPPRGARVIAIAVGGAADSRVVRPRSAAQNPRAVRRSRKVGGAVQRRIGIAICPFVETVFPDIAVHVVQPELIGRECSRTRRRPSENPGRALTVGARTIF